MNKIKLILTVALSTLSVSVASAIEVASKDLLFRALVGQKLVEDRNGTLVPSPTLAADARQYIEILLVGISGDSLMLPDSVSLSGRQRALNNALLVYLEQIETYRQTEGDEQAIPAFMFWNLEIYARTAEERTMALKGLYNNVIAEVFSWQYLSKSPLTLELTTARLTFLVGAQSESLWTPDLCEALIQSVLATQGAGLWEQFEKPLAHSFNNVFSKRPDVALTYLERLKNSSGDTDAVIMKMRTLSDVLGIEYSEDLTVSSGAASVEEWIKSIKGAGDVKSILR